VTPLLKGLILCGVQTAMVLSIGGKLLLDRATQSRLWVRVAPYDPYSPIRGRYVSLTLDAEARGFREGTVYDQANFSVEDGKLVARPAAMDGTSATIANGVVPVRVAYFIPEHVPDPSLRASGEELWAEVTVPRRGPPRPIQLGVKKNGVIAPLAMN
jgi:GDYXXLXY protein